MGQSSCGTVALKIHVGTNRKIFKLLLSETTDPSDIKLGIIFF
jgi:hypothetical protein